MNEQVIHNNSPDQRTAVRMEELNRLKSMWASVVLAALDDAIMDNRRYGNGEDQIARWARSRDGQEVLTSAVINPNGRVVLNLQRFVSHGVRTSVALSAENLNSLD